MEAIGFLAWVSRWDWEGNSHRFHIPSDARQAIGRQENPRVVKVEVVKSGTYQFEFLLDPSHLL